MRSLLHLSELVDDARRDSADQLDFHLTTGEMLVLDAHACWQARRAPLPAPPLLRSAPRGTFSARVWFSPVSHAPRPRVAERG